MHFGKGCVAGNVTSAFSLCLCFALRSCLADAAEIFCFEGINGLSSMHQKWSRSPTQTRRVSDVISTMLSGVDYLKSDYASA